MVVFFIIVKKNRIEVYIDGASSGNPGPAGCGVVIRTDKSQREIMCFIGVATNNIAEYSSLIIALEEIKDKTDCDIIIFSDSELLVRQVNGEYKVKNKNLLSLYNRVRRLWRTRYSLVHIPREENRLADTLAKRAIRLAHLVGQGGRLSLEGQEESPSCRGQGSG